jgi:diguanylate cyclase (GGDEF)-like protein/PAS domain S-box-containing protein
MSAPPTAPDASALPWDRLPGMAMLLDGTGTVRYANAALRAFVGSAEQLQGADWLAWLAPDSRRSFRDALAQRSDFFLPLELMRQDGRTGWLDCAARWLPAGAGFEAHCLCLLHDVTAGTLAQASAQAQAGLFRLLADNVPVLIAYFRASDLQCQFANAGYAATFGRDVQSIVGLTVEQVIGDVAARQIQPHVDRVLHEGVAVAYERQLHGPDEQPRWIEVNLVPHRDVQGTTIGSFVLISDITRFRLGERAVRESEERLAKFMQASAEGIVFHQESRIVDANPPLCDLIGYSLDELRGRLTLDFIAPDHVARVAAVIASGQETTYESVVIDRHGERIPVEFIVRTMLRNGERLRMTIVRDIRDRHAAQARIHHLAHSDPLTGLPNRRAFMERLEQALQTSLAHDQRLALLFIDLDHFKRVNDSLGHLAGDTLLRSVGARITACLRGTDLVARFGGDEFMVLLPELPLEPQQRHDAEEVAQKLIAVIEAPLHADGRPISVTPSIGIALYPADGASADQLVKHADSAMYVAKARGRANYQFFDPSIASSAYAALVMEGELAQALQRGEFALYFQPQVHAVDGGLIGAEALIRWNHPERGLLEPDDFIPLAERQRLILPIGQWVLEEALRCAARWLELGMAVGPIAVNLSSIQFEAAGFVDSLLQMLPRAGVTGQALELELTERMLMDDIGEVKQRLHRLKAMGVRIAVDDFGTGYSSLAHLKELPIDKVKIDRSFVHDLPTSADSAAIARAIIQMGRSLGMTVMAEGVENEAQRAFLAAQGCDELQGLLISPPLTAAAFEAWAVQRSAPTP